MKTLLAIRQGDVILIPYAVPSGAQRIEGPAILAHGETTGHAHAVEVEEGIGLALYEHDGLTYLRVTGGEALLRHGALGGGRIRELSEPEHRTLSVPPGDYLVPGQCAWTVERGASRVAD